MIKTVLKLIVKVLESKLVKSGLEETILKNQNYITIGKQIWSLIDENCRISKTVEEKLESKGDQFIKAILAKFPELTEDDAIQLRQAIAGEVNDGKEAVLDNSTLIKQLQEDNTNLQTELAAITAQLNKVQALVVTPVSTETTTA